MGAMRVWRSPRRSPRGGAAFWLRWVVLGAVLVLWPRPALAQCDGGPCVDVAVPDAGVRTDAGSGPRCGGSGWTALLGTAERRVLVMQPSAATTGP